MKMKTIACFMQFNVIVVFMVMVSFSSASAKVSSTQEQAAEDLLVHHVGFHAELSRLGV